MRTKQIKINGVTKTATLLAGITGLVKIYSIEGLDGLWLKVGKSLFTLQDDSLAMEFVNLKYQPLEKHAQIIKEMTKLCEMYR